jgi:hypothetical protein
MSDLEDLFHQLADSFDGELELVRWMPDESAHLRARKPGWTGSEHFRIKLVLAAEAKEGELIGLVLVTPCREDGEPDRDCAEAYVSPVPSAVLAVALR